MTNSFHTIDIVLDGHSHSVGDLLLEKTGAGKKHLVSLIRRLIARCNGGIDFGERLAEEWTKYLILLMDNCGGNLSNPYSDLMHYRAEIITESEAYATPTRSVHVLHSIPDRPLSDTPPEEKNTLEKSLFILAVGGADSTFYQGLTDDEILALEEALFAPAVRSCFGKDRIPGSIPRALAGKTDASGRSVSILESVMLQAYHAGIRNIAVIVNSRTANPISAYLDRTIGRLKNLNVFVTIQPLLPVLQRRTVDDRWTVSQENGSYPGGHGHGFKYCLLNPSIQLAVREKNLDTFIFSNGDNLVLFNWGAGHMVQVLRELNEEKAVSRRVAFLLVWEHFRKGGFAFRLTRKDTCQSHVQMIEAELAAAVSGVCIPESSTARAAYNTNAVFGRIKSVLDRLIDLPLALKYKSTNGIRRCVFEASLSTALTVRQNTDGTSNFDGDAALFFLPPREAVFPHWSHISIRKRSDLFAFSSSLFKVDALADPFGTFPLLVSRRNATIRYPDLEGNILEAGILNTKAFFDMFRESTMDVDDFTGTLKIDLLDAADKPRGKIQFRGKIKLVGSEPIRITVPAGGHWILENRTIHSPATVRP